MRVVINEREYNYSSDYPDGWKFISKDYFKFPVAIGNANLFIKRFPLRKSNASGLELLTKLRGKHEPHLPRVHDVVEVTEGNKPFKYTFTNCISGITLNKLLDQGGYADLKKLALHIFSALASLHKYEFWFPDFCERNIFCESGGRFLLIDLDSCEPFSLAPDINLDVSKDYWAPVFSYYKDVLDIRLNPPDLPGQALNYLQLIFLIFQIKARSANGTYQHPTDAEFNSLHKDLDAAYPSAKNVFRNFLESSRYLNRPLPIREVQELIFGEMLKSPDALLEEKARLKEKKPSIEYFSVAAKKVEQKILLEVKWTTENALELQLLREGINVRNLKGDSGSLIINETYDGVNREIAYELVAIRGAERVKSEPAKVQPNDSFAFKEADQSVNRVLQFLAHHKWKILAALVVVIAATWFIPGRTKHPQITITRVAPKIVERNFTFVVQGENLPKDPGEVQVLFNQNAARILFSSKHVITAIVPDLGTSAIGRLVKVQIVVDGDTTLASDSIRFRLR